MKESALERLVLDELADLGWSTVNGPDIAPGEPGSERSDYRDVVLSGRVREAIARLNPELPATAVDDAVKTLLRPESQSVLAENWRAYQLLTQGVPVEYRRSNGSI